MERRQLAGNGREAFKKNDLDCYAIFCGQDARAPTKRLLSPFRVTFHFKKSLINESTKKRRNVLCRKFKISGENEMKKKLNLLSTIFVLLIFSSFASATVTVPLNSGFDHWFGVPYGVSPSPPGLPKTDNYWINVSNPLSFVPSFAITGHPSWLGNPLLSHTNILNVVTNSQWVNFQNTWNSVFPTSPDNPRFAIYRKCFCLQQGYTTPNMRFSLRADDYSAVFFNGSTNILLAPGPGQFNTGNLPRTYSTTTGVGFSTGPYRGFKVGSNCLYVFVEDDGTATGFDLAGEMSVGSGMLSMPASGPNQSYAPCACGAQGPVGDSPIKNQTKRPTVTAEEDDTETIKGILKFAEERRLQRMKNAPKQK